MLNYILKNKYRRRLLFIAVGLVVWAAVALPTALTLLEVGFDELDRRGRNTLYSSGSKDSVYIVLHLQHFDLQRRIIKYYANVLPKGKYSSYGQSKWNDDITVDFGQIIFHFKNGSKIEPVIFESALQSGNMMDYPFDYYKTKVYFLAEETNNEKFIPVTVATSINAPNIVMDFTRDEDTIIEDNDLLSYTVHIHRTSLVYAICVFVSVVTWALVVVHLNFTIDTTFLGRELPLSLPALGVSLLFAIPAFRGAQPDIPSIGCALDFLCFIWCEILISICTSLNFYTWLSKLKNESNS